jgi:hypothetical protein
MKQPPKQRIKPRQGGNKGRPGKGRQEGHKRDFSPKQAASGAVSDDEKPFRRPEKPQIRANLWGAHAVREAWLNPARTITALYITEQALKEFQPALDGAKARSTPSRWKTFLFRT